MKMQLLVLVIALLFAGVGNLAYGLPKVDKYYRLSGRARAFWNKPWVIGLIAGVAVGIAVIVRFGSINLLLLFPLFTLGTVLTVIDAGTQRLPRSMTAIFLTLVVVAIVLAGFITGQWVKPAYALIVAIGSFILLLPGTFVRHGIGAGDLRLVPLLMALATCSSWHCLLAMGILSVVGSGLWALYLVIAKKASGSTRLAFGPWLLAATYIALLVVPR
ncbi:prepilin peptidase [uncultured Varibaculum sp.]|uniref:prepilin peptidase n=1 Tax=uncultured Varibaculum sp. TaxID=413896 RepID=UPI00258DBD04|nr:prepilin peptidase [uncultured Varibaculum sp.]